jgi:glycosyltransferase involved in cell wall biosynthesis
MAICGQQVGVIHAHGLNAAFIAKLLKRLFKRRLVTSIHAVYNLAPGSWLGRAFRWTLSASDVILTLSNRSRAELIALGLPEAQVKVCTYWVDQRKFRPIQATGHRKQMGWEGRFVVLFVGRLIAIKGIELLLKVAERSDERFLFAFAGDGPMAVKIQEAAPRLPNVCVLGRIDNRDLPRYYNAADVLAVPSHYEEGFGRVIVEALSCCLPVIGSRRGGIPEAVDDTVGVLVEPTVDAFQTAIVSLYQEPARLKQLRRNCRTFAERRYSDRNGQSVLDAYRSGVMSPQGPR